jgi:hypothetical protein
MSGNSKARFIKNVSVVSISLKQGDFLLLVLQLAPKPRKSQ